MQEVWGTGAFQGRTHHQKPPNGSQGQRSYPEKVELYKYTLVIRWSVMKSTLGNQQGPLLKGSRNIKRLPPLYMIIPSDQVMKSTLTTSV